MRITFPKRHERKLNDVINDFINREASVDLFFYNKNLNLLRDKINYKEKGGSLK